MSNGTACCAAEVCCDPAAARLKVKSALVARGADPAYCDLLFAFMDHEGLMFADVSLRPFVQHLVQAAKHQG